MNVADVSGVMLCTLLEIVNARPFEMLENSSFKSYKAPVENISCYINWKPVCFVLVVFRFTCSFYLVFCIFALFKNESFTEVTHSL